MFSRMHTAVFGEFPPVVPRSRSGRRCVQPGFQPSDAHE
jgi:hypothetical protein